MANRRCSSIDLIWGLQVLSYDGWKDQDARHWGWWVYLGFLLFSYDSYWLVDPKSKRFQKTMCHVSTRVPYMMYANVPQILSRVRVDCATLKSRCSYKKPGLCFWDQKSHCSQVLRLHFLNTYTCKHRRKKRLFLLPKQKGHIKLKFNFFPFHFNVNNLVLSG